MVSFWPWKGDDNSPASFEKALSSLSTKITKSTEKVDSLRQRARRFGLLWTLYSSFAYLLYSIILLLVIGWRNWGAVEYAAVAGGPFITYSVRLAILTYYSYRTSNVQSHLDELEKQRNTTIEKLKAATKYNSTQELLKKYGGTPSPKGKTNTSPKQATAGASTPNRGRTNTVPPPTANIPGRNIGVSLPSTPQRSTPEVKSPLNEIVPHSAAAATPPWQRQPSHQDTGAEFAPNAFPSAPQYSQPGEGPRWYDRLVDALLGEDETLPKNRMALICHECRLVNGQAPPGVKRLEGVGKWRCGGCGAMNGEESEAKKIMSSIQKQETPAEGEPLPSKASSTHSRKQEEDAVPGDQSNSEHESDVTQYTDSSSENIQPPAEPAAEPEAPRRRSSRPKRSPKER